MHVFIRQQTHFILYKRINEKTCLRIPSNVCEVFLKKDRSKLFASYVAGIFQKKTPVSVQLLERLLPRNIS